LWGTVATPKFPASTAAHKGPGLRQYWKHCALAGSVPLRPATASIFMALYEVNAEKPEGEQTQNKIPMDAV
jgi:hypothetical protein